MLMNMVRIVIEQIDTTKTVKDPDFREQVGVKFRTTRKVLSGQVNLARKKQYFQTDRTRTGDREPTTGHVLFRKADLDNAGVILRKGDMVVEVGPESNPTPMNTILTQVRPESPLRGDFLLIYCEFELDSEKRGSFQYVGER